MSDDRFERHLREIPLNGPAPEVKRRLVQRAAARMRAHRREHTVRLVLAAAAALLIAVNLVFGQMHEARLSAILGPEALQSVEGRGPIYADAFAERQRLTSMMLEDASFPGGGDEDGQRALPDLQTNRQWHSAFVA